MSRLALPSSATSRLALVSAVMLLGCAHAPSARAPEALTQIQWSGPPPHVGVQLAGAAASGELQAQCDAAVAHSGAIVDGNATVQAIVTLDGAGARLDLLSQRRGVVRSEPRPSLPVERLCAQAAVAAAALLRDELGGSPMDSATGSYAIMPTPSDNLHSPNAHGTGYEPNPQRSGQAASGPIE